MAASSVPPVSGDGAAVKGHPSRCNCPRAYGLQGCHERIDLPGAEQAVWAPRRQIRERGLVETRGFNDSMLRQVIHDEIDKLQLIGRQMFVGGEARHRLLRRAPIEAYERADEQSEPVGFVARAPQSLGRAYSALDQHSFQLCQITGRQRAIHAELPNGDVIEVGPQEGPSFIPELVVVGARREARQLDLSLCVHNVFKVRVHDLALALIDQLHQIAKAPAHGLEHGDRHVLPPLLRL